MRKFPGALCLGRDGRVYVGIYNYQHDVYVRPSVDMNGLERLAHVSYSKGRKKGGIDYFLITDGRDPEEVARIKKDIIIGKTSSSIHIREDKIQKIKEHTVHFPEKLPFVDNSYDIQEELLPVSQEIRDDLNTFSRSDVMVFCGFEFAKDFRGPRTHVVDKIIPRTAIRRINPERVITGGKQGITPQCILTGNIDFVKGCITGFVPGEGGGLFDGEVFHNFFSMPSGECEYCYAGQQHKGFAKNFYQFDKQRLLNELRGDCRLIYNSDKVHGKPIDVLRFGKRTESWTPFTHEEFMQTLDACAMTGARPVIPTKFLPYTPEIASLLKRTNAVVLYSIGWDELEQGAVMHGKTNKYRIEQARRYNEEGVTSVVYLMMHAHLPPGPREREVLALGLPTQLLPMRTKGRKQTQKLTGERWDDLLYSKPQGMLDFNDGANIGTHVKMGQATVATKVRKIHPFWQNLVKNNQGRIRMCHHDNSYMVCGECFQGEGFIDNYQPGTSSY